MSGTGSYACQLAKNVFKAGKVITTVSTAKVARVSGLLGDGVVDEIIGYTNQSPAAAIPAGSVDFCLDTTGQAMSWLSLMAPSTSMIVSISTTPSGTQMQESDFMRRPDRPQLPWLPRMFLNAADGIGRFRAWRWGVEYSYLFVDGDADDLDAPRGYVEAGKVKPVLGTVVQLRDKVEVRKAAGQVYHGEGGIGKAVIMVR